MVVLNTGAGVLMPWLGQVKGVLWRCGSPARRAAPPPPTCSSARRTRPGRLPITFPADNASTPFAGHPERATGVDGQIVWSEGLQMGYRWYLANDVTPLFPFGFGLSYSSFAYSGLRVSGPTAHPGVVKVSFRVRNTGRVTGTEVPQLYLTLPAAAGEPSQRLVGFDRVTLKPGQSTTVRSVIEPAAPNARCRSGTAPRTPGGCRADGSRCPSARRWRTRR